jgi:hypothetical protein
MLRKISNQSSKARENSPPHSFYNGRFAKKEKKESLSGHI